ETELDVPAEIINNRIVVPLRFIVENMNLQIDWDQDTNTIEISEPGTSESDESTTTESTEPTTTESGE
ncbi:MAG: copper amine oxidase N-terminal domain-containing protein, partial [Clostridia bacterium]|nr:copper amine oxidase N-terminal domain-containing protein [Clostridia bacterium]